jgi:uncharacterized alkaline shock family protein YloU
MSHVESTPLGTVTIPAGLLDQIVRRAAESVDGATVRRRGLTIDGRRVTLPLNARYGTVLPELARDVQARVHETLAAICGIETAAVDVAIVELSLTVRGA